MSGGATMSDKAWVLAAIDRCPDIGWREQAVKALDRISALSSSGQGERDIDDACMWYRHDFGLLSEAEKEHLRFEARDWQRALSKAKPAAPAPEKGEARRPSRDWQIAQLLEATCLIKSEAALMREGTSRELTTTAVEAAIGYLRRLLDVTAPARPAEQREEP